MIGRRNLIQMLGFTPFAGRTAAKHLSTVMASAGGPVGVLVGSGDQVASGRPAGKLWSLVNQARDDLQEEIYRRHHHRINGLEPDIHVLRSISAVNKLRMQRERDQQDDDLLRQARRWLNAN